MIVSQKQCQREHFNVVSADLPPLSVQAAAKQGWQKRKSKSKPSETHLRSAQVWHPLLRDFTVLPAHRRVNQLME